PRMPALRRYSALFQRPNNQTATRSYRLADRVTPFEDDGVQAAFRGFGRGGKAGRSAADDDDVGRLTGHGIDDSSTLRTGFRERQELLQAADHHDIAARRGSDVDRVL